VDRTVARALCVMVFVCAWVVACRWKARGVSVRRGGFIVMGISCHGTTTVMQHKQVYALEAHYIQEAASYSAREYHRNRKLRDALIHLILLSI